MLETASDFEYRKVAMSSTRMLPYWGARFLKLHGNAISGGSPRRVLEYDVSAAVFLMEAQ